ncbi:MAG: sugar-binding transcriptional regulator [Chloroflexi bacterium]|jgi:DNA-binding transcriptional regulator LsrR (DeoR family)|nr:sugar-binding transcriptional regulator [Anaerolineaceae bacterium]NMB89611.1 sugar-binding transcriptional regulator [Chloroflexota bacterium]
MSALFNDYENARLISRILTLYYVENKNQAEIGRELGLSTAKVNRLLKQARSQGMVEITIHTPFEHLFDLEHKIQTVTGVQQAIVIPQLADNPSSILQLVGKAAADYLLEHLHDGDTLCVGGGRALATLIQSVSPGQPFDVQVVPALGGTQGRHFTDVNNLTAELAKQLGGQAYQLHAPAFVDTPEEREALCNLRHVKEVLDMARQAQIALLGVGTIYPGTSSYFQFTSLASENLQDLIEKRDSVGEILAHVLNKRGQASAPEYEQRVIGIELEDLRSIPLTIGVATGVEKAWPIAAGLKGGYLKTIITDEVTALRVLEIYQGEMLAAEPADTAGR